MKNLYDLKFKPESQNWFEKPTKPDKSVPVSKSKNVDTVFKLKKIQTNFKPDN